MQQSLHRIGRQLREAFSGGDGSRLEVPAFAALLLLVVAAPLSYGGVLPGGRTGIEVGAFLIAAATYLSRPRSRNPAPSVPVMAMLSIAILGALQLLPLPGSVLERISPVSATIYHETAQILDEFGRPGASPRISIAPHETAGALRFVLAQLALFLASIRLLEGRARRRVFVAVLLGGAVLHVAAAAALRVPSLRMHGAFVNPNHLAGYLEVVLAVAFGTLWSEVLQNPERARAAADRSERLESRFLPLVVRILVWVVLAAGIGLTQSRGGITAAGLTTLIMLLLAVSHPRTRSERRRAWRGVLTVLTSVGLVAAVVGGVPLLRFLASDSRDLHGGLRLVLWKTSLEAWRQYPWLGSGLGTFREAFRRVQPRSLNILLEQAHSDPLQLLVTGGGVGLALGALASLSMLVLLLRRWRAQRHREESALTLAGIGALISLSLHGLVEFNMSIPAIPATLACVLGLSWAAGNEKAWRIG